MVSKSNMKKSQRHDMKREGKKKPVSRKQAVKQTMKQTMKQTILGRIKESVLVQSFRTIGINFIFAGLFDLLFVILLALSARSIFSLLFKNLQTFEPLYKVILSMGSFSSASVGSLSAAQLQQFYSFNSMIPGIIAIIAAGYLVFVLLSSILSSLIYSRLSKMPFTIGLAAKNLLFNLAHFTLFILIFMQGIRFKNIILLYAYLIAVCIVMLTFYFTSKPALLYNGFFKAIKRSFMLLFMNAHSFIIAYLSLIVMSFIALKIFGLFSALNKILGLVLFFIFLLFMLSWFRNYFIIAYKKRFEAKDG